MKVNTCVVGNDPVLLTGGTDRFIRLWHLNNPMESSCIVKAGVGSEKIDISYRYGINCTYASKADFDQE